ncbi:MAG: asparagine synthase (glutamine-hydrolyzing) [Candidatus Altiarchaeota archaeon]|nr:asparagine synthase (glutamine-hydrolyzing) [Candidatus Altiarchaeota archaeon]
MCGICGFVGLEDKGLLSRMNGVIQHRGPNESGIYMDKNIGLGHQRLSIIDLRTGKQPVHNEDQSIWISYNGETYNFLDLRVELEEKGHKFYTNTDTEVLIHLYEEEGDLFVKKLNGMFAFALWDSNQKKLLLARDKIGIKPLYYTISEDGSFLFASEIKSILQYENLERAVDLEALNLTINLMYIPGERTMFRGIKKLLPGFILTYKDGKTNLHRYWNLNINPIKDSESYYARELRRLLEDAVKSHMISDVPIGSFLSGGLDTSTMVALMSKFSEEPVKTFCMGFGEDTDELSDARLVAEHFGTEHYEFIITPKKGLQILEKAIWHVEMPKINLFPYYVSELAAKKAKVCISGLGGDELFAGYLRRYKAVLLADRIRKLIPAVVKGNLFTKLGFVDRGGRYNYFLALSKLDDWADFYLVLFGDVLDKNELDRLYLMGANNGDLKAEFATFFNNDLHPVDKVLLADIKTQLVDDYLVVDDAMSMANSLEIRVPFLDAELIDLSCKIPWNLKYRNGLGKYILRRAMSDILPKEIFRKKKRGFGMSSYSWFKDELREYSQQLLESEAINDYFKRDRLEKIFRNAENESHRHHQLMLTLLSFNIWYKRFIED